jgi:hypothetical protein
LLPWNPIARAGFPVVSRGRHGGGGSLAELIGRFVTLPLRVTKLAAETLTGNRDAMRLDPDDVRLGSVYGMTPGSPLITALAGIPVAASVTANSIVAVQGDGPIETGNDGVVQYSSTHIDEAESELVVWSGPSCNQIQRRWRRYAAFFCRSGSWPVREVVRRSAQRPWRGRQRRPFPRSGICRRLYPRDRNA